MSAPSAEYQGVRQNTNPVAATTGMESPSASTESSSHITADEERMTSEVFVAKFDPDLDKNYDGWPDAWRRRLEPGFPHYIESRLESTAADNHALCVHLNGGHFAAFGPEIPVNPRFSYQFSAEITNHGRQDVAYLAVRWLNAERQVISEVRTPPAFSAQEPQTMTFTPRKAPTAARYIQPVLETEPGRLPDLDGEIWFDDVLVTSAPQIQLELEGAAQRVHLFRPNETPTARLAVHGLFAEADDVAVRVTVVNERGAAMIEPQDYSVATRGTTSGATANNSTSEFETQIELPNPGVGYYLLNATLLEGDRPVTSRKIAWVVVEDVAHRFHRDFSWAAENGADPLSESQLVELAAAAGIGWLKYPVWAEPEDDERIANLAHFADELASRDIRLVGLLNHPPNEVLESLPEGTPRNAAGVFSLPVDNWYPHFLPTQRRIAMSVRRWQLSADDDMSFVGYRNLPLRIREVRSALDRLGNNVRLGIAWNWLHPLPTTTAGSTVNPGGPPWTEISLSARPPLTPAEMARYLAADNAANGSNVERWVNVEPLLASTHSLEARATHLAKQMAAAKAFGAAGVNLPRALTPQQGIIHADGSPAELFLVWRTLATQLTGAEFLGSFRMAGGSQNLVFVRAGEALMVVWNEQPTQETMYLGEDVQHLNLWGRELPLETQDHAQTFPVNSTPTILTNLNPLIARFRMSVQLENEIVPPVFGRTFSNSIAFGNPFPYPIAGRAEIATLPGWKVSAGTGEFNLQENETTQQSFYANFPYTAETGRQLLQLNFRLVADRDYRFKVFRDIEVGMPEIQWDMMTRIDSDGVLHIEHRLRNLDNRPYRVRAILYAPNRQRRSTPLLSIEPGINYHEMQIRDADDLRGQKVRVLLEEPGTNRFLNRHILLGN